MAGTSGNKIKHNPDGGAVLTLALNSLDVKVLSLMADDELRTVPDQALWELRLNLGNWLVKNDDRLSPEDAGTTTGATTGDVGLFNYTVVAHD